MKLKFEIINAREIQDGDIFYCTPDFEMNEFGPDHFITGTDQIFIKDDDFDEDDDGNYAILVNGGWTVWFRPDEKVVRLAEYGDLIRIITMVKEGNPDMAVGPNDSGTLVDQVKAQNPDLNIDLLAGLEPLSPLDNIMDEEDHNDDPDHDIDDTLPF